MTSRVLTIVGIVIMSLVYIVLIFLLIFFMVKGNYKSAKRSSSNISDLRSSSSSSSQIVQVHAGVDSNAETISVTPNVPTLVDALNICRTSELCRAFKYSRQNNTMSVLDVTNVDIEQTLSLNDNFDIYTI